MNLKTRQLAVCAAALAALVLLPAGSASASSATIEAALTSYNTQLAAAEGQITSAIDAFPTTKNAAAVQAAITQEITILRALKKTVAHAHAGSHKLRRARAKVVDAVTSVILTYRDLSKAFGDFAAQPAKGRGELKGAEQAIKRASRQLRQGEKLLA